MSTPYDRTFKSIADYDPEALLRWLGALGSEEPVNILALPRELRTPVRVPDLLYDVRSGDVRQLVHIEAQTRYHSSLSQRVLEYAALAWLQHRVPVVSYVILLTARDCPALLSREADARAGGLRMEYTRIKLWEIAPDRALASNRPNLWPLIPLMRSADADLRLVAQRLGRLVDQAMRRELAMQFVLLGALRHDRDDLLRLVEEHMITREDLSESGFYQLIVEEGIEKGIEKGRGQGAVGLLSRLLERRFGPLPSWAVVRLNAANLDTLEAWGVRALEAPALGLTELLA